MEDIREVPSLEKFPLNLKTPNHGFAQTAPMSLEDQHEWLEARRVTLLTRLELALALNNSVPDWLVAEWLHLQNARDRLLHHRICQDNWSLFVVELSRMRARLVLLLRWPVCDSWDTHHLHQLSADWLLVCRRLQASSVTSHRTP
ncbi:uncharacterized protein LOC119102463 [Pollicipes pollicipes]|uniref:uncharacterized protein LOC119102463 n=1 Tax=Pollicipes pollicipes TaxID=41117 RepID=UPI0018854598|nr:uncharacterized protein LOC119102463 [Pollicipes pollicipes]